MGVRAKLKLSLVTTERFNPDHPGYVKLKFATEYDTTIPEDQRFQKATPWGEAIFQVDNPAALEQFQVGRSYYIDFTPA